MNRKSVVILVFIALLCVVSGVYAKGALQNANALNDYMGLTREAVKRIAPYFEEQWENYYLVDAQYYGADDYVALMVEFGNRGTVESVDVWLTGGAVNELKDTGLMEEAVIWLWKLGVKYAWDWADSYESDLEGGWGLVDQFLVKLWGKGVQVIDKAVIQKIGLQHAEVIGMNYLGISYEAISDQKDADNCHVLYTVTDDLIITLEAEKDLYVVSYTLG